MTDQPLHGLRLWVTRPSNQAAALITLLSNAGAEVLALPLLEIAPPLDSVPLADALERLSEFDIAVFVSPSALDAVMGRLHGQWPHHLAAAVMGPGSALKASTLGLPHIIAPTSQFDSDGLLQLPAMQSLAGKNLVLFQGDGGRETLPETLLARGARLTRVAAYRRLPPAFDHAYLQAQLAAGCAGVIISSSEAVQYLFDLGRGATLEQLQSLLYFAPHPRIITALHDQGARQTCLTAVGDSGITETIVNHFGSRQTGPNTAKNTHDAG